MNSTTKISTEFREFDNVEELIKTSVLSDYEVRMLGKKKSYWWKDCTVCFPDKQTSSQSFVEVQGKTVTVGYGNCYFSYKFGSFEEALSFADQTNKQWLESDLSAEEFLKKFSA